MARLNEPLVSVLINCYNGEDFLKDAIDSVYAQTYQNWEIVFWDNASTDNTKSIACSYNEKLRYFKASKLTNLHEARNLAVEQCNGLTVAFLDADDMWLPNKLENQIKIFTEGHRIIYGGYKYVDESGKSTGFEQTNCPSGFLTSQLIRKNSISVGSVLIDIELLRQFKFDEYYEMMGDFDLWIRLAKEFKIKGVSEIVELSRQHGSNMSITRAKRWLSERRHFYKKFLMSNSIFQFPGIVFYILKTEIKGLRNAR